MNYTYYTKSGRCVRETKPDAYAYAQVKTRSLQNKIIITLLLD